MTPSRAQIDAAETWLLEEWRINADTSRRITSGKNAKRQWATDELAARRDTRAKLATAIRAIRAQRKALDAEAPPTVRKSCDGCEFLWHGSEGVRACHHPSTSGPVGTPQVVAHKPPPEWCPLRKGAA
jgi:hypothetical protein